MQTMKTPPSDHAQFDQMCAEVGDFEPLPSVAAAPAPEDAEHEDVQAAPIDELILAGLISP